MKCEICNKRKAEVINSPKYDGYWRFECIECESVGYWIGLERIDTEDKLNNWVNHLNQKNWFMDGIFDSKIRRWIQYATN